MESFIWLLFLLFPFLFALPLVLFPYVAGTAINHIRERNWPVAVGWCFLIIALLWPVLATLPPPAIESWMNYVEYVRVAVQWLMLGQAIFWWVVWHRAYVRRRTRGWGTVALPAFIISALISFYLGPLLTLVALLITFIATSNERKRWDRIEVVEARRPSVGAGDAVPTDLGAIGFRPYPNADYTDTETRIVTGGGALGKSLKFQFRTIDAPERVLSFYETSAKAAGLDVRRATRRMEDPSLPAVPALVAMGSDPVALVVYRDPQDEFKWVVTVYLRTWPGFRRDLDLYFDFEEPLREVGRPVYEPRPPRKPIAEYTVFQQHPEGEAVQPAPGPPPAEAAFVPEHPIYPPPPPRPPRAPKIAFNWGDFVEAVAAVWYVWVGVTMIVLGLGYWLSLEYGALGRIVAVYAIFITMWSGGVYYERVKRYSTLGKALIAGGWAGVYVTTFLIHYLPQARVITNPTVGMFLLMAIAIGMIAHSFRYKSEVLTTLTYFVAFVTIGFSVQLSEQRFFSLVATAVLAVSMLFILYRMQWYRLVLFGIVGCYGTHAIWLYPFLPQIEAPGPLGAELWAGLWMLALYWVTFTAGVFLFKPRTKGHDAMSLWMTALNFFLFFLVYRYQLGTERADLRLWIVEALALAYIFLSWLAWFLKRDNLYTLNLVIAVLCTTMTLYYHLLGGEWVTVGWLIQAEALYVAGLLGDEKRYRTIAIGNFILVGVWMITHDFWMTDTVTLFGLVLFKRTVIAATVALFFYINAILRHVLAYRIKNEEGYSYLFSYAASILWLVIMVRNWYPDDPLKIAVGSAIFGLFLMETGIRMWDHHFRIQGLFYVFLSVIAGLLPLALADTFYYTENVAYRLVAEGIVTVFAYIVFARFHRRISIEEDARRIEFAVGLMSSIAALFAVMLLYREFSLDAPAWIVFAWMVVGVMLVEIGLATRNPFFRAQGYLVTGLTLLWAFYLFFLRPIFYWFLFSPTLYSPAPFHPLANLLVVLAFFYLFARILYASGLEKSGFSEAETREHWSESGPTLAVLLSIGGTLILILTFQRELIEFRPLFIAAAWLAVGIALLEAGIALCSRPLRLQALFVAGIAFLYALFHNLVPGMSLGPFSDRFITLLLCIAALYYLFWRFSMGERVEEGKAGWADPDLPWATISLSWFAAILFALLIERELWIVAPAWVAPAWIVPMLVFFYIGVRYKSRNFLVQTMVLSGIIFLWTLSLNIAEMWTSPISLQFEAHRLASVVPIIFIFYVLFSYLLARRRELAGEDLGGYFMYARGLFSWFAAALLTALIASEIGKYSHTLITVIWIALAIAFFEVSRITRSRSMEAQGYTLATASFVRAMFVDFRFEDEKLLFMQGSIASVILVAAGLYYLWLRLPRTDEETPTSLTTGQMGSAMSYMGTVSLIALMAREIEPVAWIAPAWSGLMLLLLALGVLFTDRRLIFQALLMMILVTLGVLFYDYPEKGTLLGREAIGLAVAAMFIARIVWHLGIQNRRERYITAGESGGVIPDWGRHVFSMPGAALLAIYVMIDLSHELTMYITLAWACEALVLMIMGFTMNDRVLRFAGIILLALSIVKVFRDILVLEYARQYKVIALIGIGVILIVTGWIYSRFRERINRTLLKE